MNYLQMQQELGARLSAYNLSVAEDLAKIERWLNLAQQYICGQFNFPFLEAYEIIQTVPDITTGTVNVTAGSASITFSSAPVASVAGRYIQFSDTDDWYRISAHTAASTSATIDPAYGQAANLTAATFTIRKLLYATSIPLDSITTIKKTVNPGRLPGLSKREGDFFLALYMDPGDPLAYIMGPMDSSGNLQFALVNPPSDVINLYVTGLRKLTDMVNTTDTSVIPARWHDGLLNIAAYFGFTALNDTRAKLELDLGNMRIKDMQRVYSTDLGRHRVVGADRENYDFGPIYTLPSNFGPMS